MHWTDSVFTCKLSRLLDDCACLSTMQVGLQAGASIPMGQGGHVPPIFGPGGHDYECPPNISRVISATFYPCNIFLIS